MMPIVDAHVGLSEHGLPLNQYLDAFTQFHVLRLVSVQRSQPAGTAEQEVHYLQALANTRGSGGFPNGIVASVDLAKPTLVNELVTAENVENVRGVVCHFDTDWAAKSVFDCKQSMDILNAARINLDVLASPRHVDTIAALAEHQPSTNVIVSAFYPLSKDAEKADESFIAQLASLAKHDNVYLKILGSGAASAAQSDAFEFVLSKYINVFGAERIMFGSGSGSGSGSGVGVGVGTDSDQADVNAHGNGQSESESMFDQLWTIYLNACASFTARQRDSLFRSNAIRVYDL